MFWSFDQLTQSVTEAALTTKNKLKASLDDMKIHSLIICIDIYLRYNVSNCQQGCIRMVEMNINIQRQKVFKFMLTALKRSRKLEQFILEFTKIVTKDNYFMRTEYTHIIVNRCFYVMCVPQRHNGHHMQAVGHLVIVAFIG